MADKNIIISELKELNSSLADSIRELPYSVPSGYFATLPHIVLTRIRALESENARQEIETLSPVLSVISRKMPFETPAGYFEQLSEKTSGEVSAAEEIEGLSPFLAGLTNKNPYSVPQGYFDEVRIPIPQVKVVRMVQRRWFRVAAAAMIAGALLVSGFFIFNKRFEKAPLAKFTRDVKKIDDTQKDNLIDFIDAGLTGKEQAKTSIESGSREIRQLLEDVSDQELKDLQEQSEDLSDVLMTN